MVDVLTWQPPQSLLATFDVLLSDLMAPTTGVEEIDGEASAALALRALSLATSLLRCGSGGSGERGGSGGSAGGSTAVVKLFQSRHSPAVLEAFSRAFHRVLTVKPKASRAESREVSDLPPPPLSIRSAPLSD